MKLHSSILMGLLALSLSACGSDEVTENMGMDSSNQTVTEDTMTKEEAVVNNNGQKEETTEDVKEEVTEQTPEGTAEETTEEVTVTPESSDADMTKDNSGTEE